MSGNGADWFPTVKPILGVGSLTTPPVWGDGKWWSMTMSTLDIDDGQPRSLLYSTDATNWKVWADFAPVYLQDNVYVDRMSAQGVCAYGNGVLVIAPGYDARFAGWKYPRVQAIKVIP